MFNFVFVNFRKVVFKQVRGHPDHHCADHVVVLDHVLRRVQLARLWTLESGHFAGLAVFWLQLRVKFVDYQPPVCETRFDSIP